MRSPGGVGPARGSSGKATRKRRGSLCLVFSCAVRCAQSCPTVCDIKDGSPPGSSVGGDSPGKNTEGNESRSSTNGMQLS